MPHVYRYGHDDPYRLDPSPLYATLRAEEPVARVSTPYGDEAWLVTRYHSVKVVLHDSRLSRAAAMAHRPGTPRSGPHTPKINPISAVDPPEHSRLRQLVSGAFTKHRARLHRPRAEQIANKLIDDLVARGNPADLDGGFAQLFSTLSLAEILGIPPAECTGLRKWTLPMWSRAGYSAEELDAAHDQLDEFSARMLDRKREDPQDDFLTALVQSKAGRNRYTNDELAFLVSSLLINESVANLIASFFYLLLTRPDELAWLRAHMEQLPRATEELLRFVPLAADAPGGGQGHVRYAVEDIVIDEVKIRSGEWVLPSIISANRDATVFDDPDRLDLTRGRNPHIAFGFGTHHCPGAALGRMQLQVALATLLNRFTDLALVAPERVPWKTGNRRGPDQLLATWSAVRAA